MPSDFWVRLDLITLTNPDSVNVAGSENNRQKKCCVVLYAQFPSQAMTFAHLHCAAGDSTPQRKD